MNQIKFRVSDDPSYARETVPAILTNAHHHFKSMGFTAGGNEKFIFLPACENYPHGLKLRYRDGLSGGEDIELWANVPVKAGSRLTKPDICDLEELAANALIAQCRARLRRKLLPAYRRWYQSYQGIVGGRILTIECESVTESSRGIVGSYMTLMAEGKAQSTIAWMKSSLVAYVGARQVTEVTEDSEGALRRIESRFLWSL